MTAPATASRIGVCRHCLSALSQPPISRQFSSSSLRLFPIRGAAPAPPSRTKFSGHASAVVTIRSGSGGKGCVSLEMSRGKPGIGLPTGGNGGRGGDVYVLAHGTGDLRGSPTVLTADRGANGEGSGIHGKKGKDVILHVPIGTVIYEMSRKLVKHDPDEFIHRPHEIEDQWQISEVQKRRATGSARNRTAMELHEEETKERGIYLDLKTWTGNPILLCRGGKGGLGNQNFASEAIRMPRFGTKGEPGTEINLLLELKLIADIALVGRPNAGKSTLLAQISGAKQARVGHWAFTTLSPQLGTVILRDGMEERCRFVVADLPGLSFRDEMAESVLKHVQRAKVAAYIIDLGSETCFEDYLFLKQHVSLRIGTNLRELVVCNKADLEGTEERMNHLRDQFAGQPGGNAVLIPICAREGLGLERVMDSLEVMVQAAREEEKDEEEKHLARMRRDLLFA
jgi:GTP-binding protein